MVFKSFSWKLKAFWILVFWFSPKGILYHSSFLWTKVLGKEIRKKKQLSCSYWNRPILLCVSNSSNWGRQMEILANEIKNTVLLEKKKCPKHLLLCFVFNEKYVTSLHRNFWSNEHATSLSENVHNVYFLEPEVPVRNLRTYPVYPWFSVKNNPNSAASAAIAWPWTTSHQC